DGAGLGNRARLGLDSLLRLGARSATGSIYQWKAPCAFGGLRSIGTPTNNICRCLVNGDGAQTPVASTKRRWLGRWVCSKPSSGRRLTLGHPSASRSAKQQHGLRPVTNVTGYVTHERLLCGKTPAQIDGAARSAPASCALLKCVARSWRTKVRTDLRTEEATKLEVHSKVTRSDCHPRS